MQGRPPKKDNLLIIRFVGVGLLSIVGFFILIYQDFTRLELLSPYTNFVALCSRLALNLFGINASGAGTIVQVPGFAINILYGCNGLEVVAILFATILAFPATWKNKLLGILVGYPVIFVINLLRIIVLFALGLNHPELFNAAHIYYAQAFVVLATLAVWLVWVFLYSSYGIKSNQALPH